MLNYDVLTIIFEYINITQIESISQLNEDFLKACMYITCPDSQSITDHIMDEVMSINHHIRIHKHHTNRTPKSVK